MRATVRRIDLTSDQAVVEMWPSLDWMSQDPAADQRPAGPHGRGGLWDAMAKAVQRVREVSLTDGPDGRGAEIITLAPDAPHLAYLARVGSSDRAGGSLPGADVIALVDRRARQAR
jgi:hypothetical protein